MITITARRFSGPMKWALGRLLDGECGWHAAGAKGEDLARREFHRNAETVGGLRIPTSAHGERRRGAFAMGIRAPALLPGYPGQALSDCRSAGRPHVGVLDSAH